MPDDSKQPYNLALTLPPPPRAFAFGAPPSYLVDGDAEELVAAARAPIFCNELVQQVAIAAASILADRDLSNEGREKKIGEIVAPAFEKLKTLERKIPNLLASRDGALAEIARAANPVPDAAELAWRATVLPALVTMSVADRSRMIQRAMIGEGGADAVRLLRAVASVPAYSLGVTDVLHEQVKTALIETTSKGSSAAAKAEKYGRAANSALHAAGVASAYLRSLAAAGSGAGLVKLVNAGVIERPAQLMSRAQKAEFISTKGLAAWERKVAVDYGS